MVYRYGETAAYSISLPIKTPEKVATVCITPSGGAYVSTPAHLAWKIFSAHLSDVSQSGMSSEHEQVEMYTLQERLWTKKTGTGNRRK